MSKSEGWRGKIRATHIVGRLAKYFDGELELTKGQITVGLALLRKVAPDLQMVKMEGMKGANVTVNLLTFEESKPILANGENHAMVPAITHKTNGNGHG